MPWSNLGSIILKCFDIGKQGLFEKAGSLQYNSLKLLVLTFSAERRSISSWHGLYFLSSPLFVFIPSLFRAVTTRNSWWGAPARKECHGVSTPFSESMKTNWPQALFGNGVVHKTPPSFCFFNIQFFCKSVFSETSVWKLNGNSPNSHIEKGREEGNEEVPFYSFSE